MSRSSWMKVFVILLLAAALTGVSVAAAQGDNPTTSVANRTESEPNNAFASADRLNIGDVVSGKIGGSGDVDTFKFVVGEAGQFTTAKLLFDMDAAALGSSLDSAICLYDRYFEEIACNNDSEGLDSLIYAPLNGDGDAYYYIKVRDWRGNAGGAAYTYRLSIYPPLLISAPVAGQVAGIPFGPEDILAHYDFADGTEKWLMFFDGSDVGITRNVSGFAAHSFLTFSFQKNQPVASLGATVKPNEFVWFEPTNLGATTAGEFSAYLPTDHTKAVGERIDAIGSSYYWAVTISPTGAFSAPNLEGEVTTARDEDLVAGAVEYGHWFGWDPLVFDGSTVPGLAAEDVVAAAHKGATDTWYLTILGSGRIDGQAFNQKDIFMVRDGTVLGRYWNGPAHHFNYVIDAIEVAD